MRMEKCSATLPQVCPCDFGSGEVSGSGILTSFRYFSEEEKGKWPGGGNVQALCVHQACISGGLPLPLFQSRAQALADFPYLLRVPHPDSTNGPSRFIGPFTSCQTLLGASVCPVCPAAECSCPADPAALLSSREMRECFPCTARPTVSIGGCPLLLQGCAVVLLLWH